MSDGVYLGDDYKFEHRKGKIEAFIWAEPPDAEEPNDEQLELFTRDDLHYSF